MNNLVNVVGLTIVSLLLASPLFLQTQNAYERDIYGQGYDVELIVDSDEATEQEEEAMEEAEEDEDNDD
jgi:hypothetical protein